MSINGETLQNARIGRERSNTLVSQKLAEEVGEALKNPPFRLDAASLRMIVGKDKDNISWKITLN